MSYLPFEKVDFGSGFSLNRPLEWPLHGEGVRQKLAVTVRPPPLSWGGKPEAATKIAPIYTHSGARLLALRERIALSPHDLR